MAWEIILPAHPIFLISKEFREGKQPSASINNKTIA